MSSLVFLHLSDIHFKKRAGSVYDRDAGLRNELELDIERFARESFRKVNGVLISGDIAYSGHVDEYAYAQTWIAKVAAFLSLSPAEDVYVIPGNHDIQRDVVQKSPTIQGYHSTLRDPHRDPNEVLVSYLDKDDVAKRIIFNPLLNYNDFAAKYQCNLSAEQPYWEYPFDLSDGSLLMVRGMNSTLVSDEYDSDGLGKLIVGSYQLDLLRQDGVEYMILCHHPPQWLIDQDEAEELLTDRARLQLFGHKHKQRLIQIDNSVRMVAGAVHPERREPNWLPRYNFVEVDVEIRSDGARHLVVKVYPRVFENTRFVSGAEGQSFKQYDLRLPAWTKPAGSHISSATESTSIAVVNSQRGLHMRPGRRLTYRFLNLPHHARLKIVQALGLVRSDDEGLRDSELYSRYFSRAAEEGHLSALWDLIDKESSTHEDNPFSSVQGAV
jgi:predicted MPP superfamily phosphohydrolase